MKRLDKNILYQYGEKQEKRNSTLSATLASDDSYFVVSNVEAFKSFKCVNLNVAFISRCFRMQSSAPSFTEPLCWVQVHDVMLSNTWEKEKKKHHEGWQTTQDMSKKPLSLKPWYSRWHVTTGHGGVVASVLNVTAHNIVAVVWFWDVIIWIYADLWGITYWQSIRINNKATTTNNQHGLLLWKQWDSHMSLFTWGSVSDKENKCHLVLQTLRI